eukprot:TRINITY_DN38992_c0_g1_i1.p1 TRINITY_DN38992_c0_g1~~TRINITY_DN38992_c0_g1_i1.p1  ORF type:complete len:171 (+),score=28.62 TRINITY_DN38992_c0_g1_i1:1-513(+)
MMTEQAGRSTPFTGLVTPAFNIALLRLVHKDNPVLSAALSAAAAKYPNPTDSNPSPTIPCDEKTNNPGHTHSLSEGLPILTHPPVHRRCSMSLLSSSPPPSPSSSPPPSKPSYSPQSMKRSRLLGDDVDPAALLGVAVTFLRAQRPRTGKESTSKSTSKNLTEPEERTHS